MADNDDPILPTAVNTFDNVNETTQIMPDVDLDLSSMSLEETANRIDFIFPDSPMLSPDEANHQKRKTNSDYVSSEAKRKRVERYCFW